MASLTAITLGVTTVFLAGLAAAGWRYREKQGAELFAVLEAVSAIWTALTIVGLQTSPGPLRIQIWGITSGLSLFVAVLWFIFILDYTGRRHWLTVRRVGVVSVPLLVGTGLYFTVPTWPLFATSLSQESISAGVVVVPSLGPLASLLGLYIYFVFLVGNILIVKTVLEGSRLFAGQALAFVTGSLVTILASFLAILGIPMQGYPLTQVALGVQAVLWGYAVFGQRFLQVMPAVAEIGERAVFDDLDDGIVVVNDGGVVVRTNPQADAHLDAGDAVGDPVEPIFETIGIEAIEELPTRFEYDRRTFQADASEIRDWQGNSSGYAVTIRDVTDLVAREQRLSVLNRVFRHNVRNDMNVVMGIGSELQRRSDDGLAEYGETLSRTARGLTRISEKAIEIDRLFEKSPATEQTDVAMLVDRIVTQLRDEYPDTTIETAVDVETVSTDSQIFRKVVTEVLTNAAEHAGPAPTVEITVERSGEDVEVTVTDDGPGIPRNELHPLQRGEETSLEHSSSFGLWFVNWGVQTLDGTLDIAAGADGTTVTLLVPSAVDASADTTPERVEQEPPAR